MSIQVEDDILNISATREQQTESTGNSFHSEFLYGTFKRRIRLPAGVSVDNVTASYDAGVLEIRIETEASTASAIDIPIDTK